MNRMSRVLDALFPFRCVVRNAVAIDKLARNKRRSLALKIAASNRLRTTIRKTVVDVCTEENNLRAMRT